MNLAFRVDASSQIGTGHFMRCLTLADAAQQRGSRTRFLSRGLPAHLQDLLGHRGHEFAPLTQHASPEPAGAPPHAHWLETSQTADADEVLQALADRPWDWVIVDHYALDTRWEGVVGPAAARLMVIDDLADRPHDCDLLLDQNLYDDRETRYRDRVPERCRLLSGPLFALLRDEFRQWHQQVAPRSGRAHRVLVCFGGSDASNHTANAIDALAGLPGYNLAVDVVIGRAHPDRAGIESACAAHGFACHVQTARMAELMAAADLAVGAGGATTWERCCVGLPALVLPVSHNQGQQVRDAAAAGVIYAPDQPGDDAVTAFLARHVRALIENSSLRHWLSARGMAAVDGRGVVRVMRHMGVDGLEVREVRPEDCANLFDWRNHPSIREASRRHEPIAWGSHQRWFAAVQADATRKLLIGHRGRTPVGVVRFDIEGDAAEVSIYLVPIGNTAGSGGPLLQAAEQWLATARPDLQRVRAHVLGPNAVSHRLFLGAGYDVESTWYFKRLAHS